MAGHQLCAIEQRWAWCLCVVMCMCVRINLVGWLTDWLTGWLGCSARVADAGAADSSLLAAIAGVGGGG